MCGILGSINVSFEKSTLDLIRHRGPDFGLIEHYLIKDNHIFFGHRRLSIVDLSSTANQPMSTIDDNYSIVFNGEIYNHLELREKLPEIQFQGFSDTETILHYIVKYGIDSIKDFNGIFALAFLYKREKKLFLARDPFGVKPLYFYISDKKMLFSSEIRPIKSLISTTLDKLSLAQLLKLRYSPSEDTLNNEIKKLHPGHYMVYDLENHEYNIKTYLKPIPQKKELSLNQALHQYGDLFEKAVKRQLMSDVEVGILLSGGVDSALISHFVVNNLPYPVKSFTVGFKDNDEANELNDAKRSAEIIGTNHHEVILNQTDFQQVLEKVIDIVEEPLGTTSSIPMYFLNEEVSKHVKVTLTGQGADEPLGGYSRYKAEIYRKHIPGFMLHLLQPFSSFIKNESLRRFIYAASEKDIIKRFEKTYTLFNDEDITLLINQKENKSYRKIQYFYDLLGAKNLTSIEAMMAVDMRMNLADDLLLYTDKVSMNFGIETRVPILDIELVEFIESLPLKYKIKNNQGKFIHKEFAKLVLPKEIVERKKKGFQSPTNKWFNQELGDYIINIMDDNNSGFHQIFDKQQVLRILTRHKSGVNQEKQLFLILSLYFWFKNANL